MIIDIIIVVISNALNEVMIDERFSLFSLDVHTGDGYMARVKHGNCFLEPGQDSAFTLMNPAARNDLPANRNAVKSFLSIDKSYRVITGFGSIIPLKDLPR